MGNSAGRKMDKIGGELSQSTRKLNVVLDRAIGSNEGRFQTGGKTKKAKKTIKKTTNTKKNIKGQKKTKQRKISTKQRKTKK